jgi:hypothetical protein
VSISITKHLKKGYPNHPELIATHLEYKHLGTIHQSSIRALLAAVGKDMHISIICRRCTIHS